jgi:hypothetical protein
MKPLHRSKNTWMTSIGTWASNWLPYRPADARFAPRPIPEEAIRRGLIAGLPDDKKQNYNLAAQEMRMPAPVWPPSPGHPSEWAQFKADQTF